MNKNNEKKITYTDIDYKIHELFQNSTINTLPSNFKEIIDKFLNNNTCKDKNIYAYNQQYALDLNINEDRIKKSKLFTNLLLDLKNKRYIFANYFNIITYPKNENSFKIIYFWKSMSDKVLNKEVLGFPLNIYLDTNVNCVPTYSGDPTNKDKVNLFFFKQIRIQSSSLYLSIYESIEMYIFQKLLIFLELYTYGMWSENFIYEEIKPTKNLNITFKVKDAFYTFSLNKIVILSPDTVLIPLNRSVLDFINCLDNTEKEFIKHKEGSFYEIFFYNFPKYLNKTVLNIKILPNILELSKPAINIIPGKIYIFSNETIKPFYGIILNKLDNFIKYVIFFDTTKTLSLKEEYVNLYENPYQLFDTNFTLDYSIFDYCIGK